MYKIILLFVLTLSTLAASDSSVSTKIVAQLVEKISGKEYLVWVEKSSSKQAIPIDKYKLNTTEICSEASILIVYSKNKLTSVCGEKPLLVLDYDLLTVHQNAVGSFFWKKGRPNIVFINSRLKKHGIILDSSYDKYREDQIW